MTAVRTWYMKFIEGNGNTKLSIFKWTHSRLAVASTTLPRRLTGDICAAVPSPASALHRSVCKLKSIQTCSTHPHVQSGPLFDDVDPSAFSGACVGPCCTFFRLEVAPPEGLLAPGACQSVFTLPVSSHSTSPITSFLFVPGLWPARDVYEPIMRSMEPGVCRGSKIVKSYFLVDQRRYAAYLYPFWIKPVTDVHGQRLPGLGVRHSGFEAAPFSRGFRPSLWVCVVCCGAHYGQRLHLVVSACQSRICLGTRELQVLLISRGPYVRSKTKNITYRSKQRIPIPIRISTPTMTVRRIPPNVGLKPATNAALQAGKALWDMIGWEDFCKDEASKGDGQCE